MLSQKRDLSRPHEPYLAAPLSVLIFTDNPGVQEVKLVAEELRRREIHVRLMTPWDFTLPRMPELDASVVYAPSNMLHRGSTYELTHRLLILRELEGRAVVVNPVESMLLYSKEQLTMRLNSLGLPHPKTIATENVEEAYDFSRVLLEQSREVVLKPTCAARGIGVTKLSGIRRRDDLLQFLVWYTREHAEGVYYLQEYIPNLGYDVRCLVIDGKVIGREKRFNPKDFRYNVAVGGSAETFNDPIYDNLSVEVTKASGLNICGVDILPGEDGKPYVLEANCYPGYKALMDATGIPVHEKIADYLQSLLR
jgi:RimK family alpha-L-glutamate ligase